MGGGDTGESSLAELPLVRGRLGAEFHDTRDPPLPIVLNDDLDDFLAILAEEKANELALACLDSDM